MPCLSCSTYCSGASTVDEMIQVLRAYPIGSLNPRYHTLAAPCDLLALFCVLQQRSYALTNRWDLPFARHTAGKCPGDRDVGPTLSPVRCLLPSHPFCWFSL